MAVLEKAGLVEVKKEQATRGGRAALAAEMTALREMTARVDGGSLA